MKPKIIKQIGLTAAAVALATGSLAGSFAIASSVLNPGASPMNLQQRAAQISRQQPHFNDHAQRGRQNQTQVSPQQGGAQAQPNQQLPRQNQQLQLQFQHGQMPNFGNMSNSTQHG